MDSLHVRWEERDAVRRAWGDAVKRLHPTSVAWIPLLDYGNARHAPADSSRGARGEALAAPCAFDSLLWAEGLPSAYGALGRLAAEQRTLVIALGLDLGGPRSYSMGQRSEEHTSELQSPCNLVCRLLLEKKKKQPTTLILTTRRTHHISSHTSSIDRR